VPRPHAGQPACTKALQHLGRVCCAHASALAKPGDAQEAVAAAAVQHIVLLTQVRLAWGLRAVRALGLLGSGAQQPS